MLALCLALSLSASESAGVEGAGPAPATSRQREAVRLRAGLQLAGGVGRGFTTYAFAFGPGLSLELGAIFKDRYSLVARGTAFTLAVVTGWSLGLGFDAALSDFLSLGVGVAWSLIWGLDAPWAASVSLPLRVVVAPFGRSAPDVGRRGLVLFAEVTPGFAYANGRGYEQMLVARGPPLSVIGALGVGYLWW